MSVGQASRLSPYSSFKSESGATPDLRRGDAIVRTTAIRASAGTRDKSKLQPTQPARRAVDESGNQIAVFGRRGARPFNGEEMKQMYLRNDQLWTVNETPGPATRK